MPDLQAPRPYHRIVTVVLVGFNLAAILWAILDGGPGQRDFHFRQESFITWLGSAQMLGAALLFLASYFAARIIPLRDPPPRETYAWLVFAVGFLLLALDQQFRLRDQVTLLLEGALPQEGDASPTAVLFKAVVALTALGLVAFFRAMVLANFRMVVAFIAGFWFIAMMLLLDLLVEGLIGPGGVTKILEGASKLLAMAMFLSASYAALLDRLQAAQGTLRQTQIPGNRDRPRPEGSILGSSPNRMRPAPLAPPSPTPPEADGTVGTQTASSGDDRQTALAPATESPDRARTPDLAGPPEKADP